MEVACLFDISLVGKSKRLEIDRVQNSAVWQPKTLDNRRCHFRGVWILIASNTDGAGLRKIWISIIVR